MWYMEVIYVANCSFYITYLNNVFDYLILNFLKYFHVVFQEK